MKRILKFTFKKVQGFESHIMPWNAKIIKVAEQYGHVTLWAECDSNILATPREFFLAFTGGSIDSSAQVHVGTALLNGGELVVHVYERI